LVLRAFHAIMIRLMDMITSGVQIDYSKPQIAA